MSNTITNWKDFWIKAKGYPWNVVACSSHIKVLHNTLIQLLLNKHSLSNTDIAWINTQFIICFKEVENSISSQNFFSEVFDDVTCQDVATAFSRCLNCLDASLHQKILIELIRSVLCLGIIWLSGKIQVSEIKDLFIICHQNNRLCSKVNPEVTYVFLKLCGFLEDSSIDLEVKPEQDHLDFQTNFVFENRCHPKIVYLHFLSVYRKHQYSILIKMCSNYLEKNKACWDQTHSWLHNITACCYFHMKKPHMAIVQWRKAVQCCEDEFHMLPLVYNLHRTYKHCEMFQPSIDVIKVAMSIVKSSQVADPPARSPSFIFQPAKSEYVTLKLQPARRKVTNALPLAYYAAQCCLKMNMASEAVAWYQDALIGSREQFDPASFSRSSEYDLPIIVPSSIQINSEYALALYETNAVDELMDLDCSDLEYCSASYQKANAEASEKQMSLPQDARMFLRCAVQLYHCVSVILYKIAASMSQGVPDSLQLIDRCLKALVDVHPATVDASDTLLDEKHSDSVHLQTVMYRLSRAKAMLYFNQAVLAASSTEPDQAACVLKSLQLCLRYDNRDIDTRWNVTLLLWRIGKREEAIKTWCKTRNINYKLDYKEIKSILNSKTSTVSSCDSETKRNYLEKDLCILNELLQMITT